MIVIILLVLLLLTTVGFLYYKKYYKKTCKISEKIEECKLIDNSYYNITTKTSNDCSIEETKSPCNKDVNCIIGNFSDITGSDCIVESDNKLYRKIREYNVVSPSFKNGKSCNSKEVLGTFYKESNLYIYNKEENKVYEKEECKNIYSEEKISNNKIILSGKKCTGSLIFCNSFPEEKTVIELDISSQQSITPVLETGNVGAYVYDYKTYYLQIVNIDLNLYNNISTTVFENFYKSILALLSVKGIVINPSYVDETSITSDNKYKIKERYYKDVPLIEPTKDETVQLCSQSCNDINKKIPLSYIASSAFFSRDANRAFDNKTNTLWESEERYGNQGEYNGSLETNGYTGEYIQASFETSINIKCLKITPSDRTTENDYSAVYYSPENFKIFGSNDLLAWTLISEIRSAKFKNPSERCFEINSQLSFKNYRVVINSLNPKYLIGTRRVMIGELKFIQ